MAEGWEEGRPEPSTPQNTRPLGSLVPLSSLDFSVGSLQTPLRVCHVLCPPQFPAVTPHVDSQAVPEVPLEG